MGADLRKQRQDPLHVFCRTADKRRLRSAYGCTGQVIGCGLYSLLSAGFGRSWWCPRQDSNLRHTV